MTSSLMVLQLSWQINKMADILMILVGYVVQSFIFLQFFSAYSSPIDGSHRLTSKESYDMLSSVANSRIRRYSMGLRGRPIRHRGYRPGYSMYGRGPGMPRGSRKGPGFPPLPFGNVFPRITYKPLAKTPVFGKKTAKPLKKPMEKAKTTKKPYRYNGVKCKEKPCENGGECVGNDVTYCACKNDYAGTKCEKRMPKCNDLACGLDECVKYSHEIFCACNATMCRRQIEEPTQQEKINAVISHDHVKIIAFAVSFGLLVVGICVYCLRVCTKRKDGHEKYRRLLKESIVPEELPPDFLSLCLCGGSAAIQKIEAQIETELVAKKKKKSKKKKKKKDKDSKTEKDDSQDTNKSTNCPWARLPTYSQTNEEHDSFDDENFSACYDKYRRTMSTNKNDDRNTVYNHKKNNNRLLPSYFNQEKGNTQRSKQYLYSDYYRNTNTSLKQEKFSQIKKSERYNTYPRKTSFLTWFSKKSPKERLDWHLHNQRTYYDPFEVINFMWSDAHVKTEVTRRYQSEDGGSFAESSTNSDSDSEDILYTRREGST